MTVMQQEYESLSNRFWFGMRDYEIKCGKKPLVVIMNQNDFLALKFLASEMCTIVDENLEMCERMRYYGVEVYQSVRISETDMIFGGFPS